MLERQYGAHQGITNMLVRAAESVWWPGLTKDVSDMHAACKKYTNTSRSQWPSIMPGTGEVCWSFPMGELCDQFDKASLTRQFTCDSVGF